MKKSLKFLLVGLIAFSQLAYPATVYADVVEEIIDDNANLNDSKDEVVVNDDTTVSSNVELFNDDTTVSSNVELFNDDITNTTLYNDTIEYDFTTSINNESDKITINLTDNTENSIIEENKYILKTTLTFNQILNDKVIDTKEDSSIILLSGLELKNYTYELTNSYLDINGEYFINLSIYNVDDEFVDIDEESLEAYILDKESIYNYKSKVYENKIETKLELLTNLECVDKVCNLDINATDKIVTFNPQIIQNDVVVDLDNTYFTYKINDEVLNDYIFNNQLDFDELLKGSYVVTVSLMDNNNQELLTDSITIVYGTSLDNTNLDTYFDFDINTDDISKLLSLLISSTVVEDNLVDVDLLRDLVNKLPVDILITNTLTKEFGYEVIASSFLEQDGNNYSVIMGEKFIGQINETDKLATVKEIKDYLATANLVAEVVDNNGNIVDDSQCISTVMKLVVYTKYNTLTYDFLVLGDLDGGLVTDSEVKTIIDVVLGLDNIDFLDKLLIDFNDDDIIDINDVSYFAASIGMKNWLATTNATDLLEGSLSIDKNEYRVNDTFKVSFVVSGFDKDYINGIEGILNYDKSALELVGMSTQNALVEYGNFNYNTSKFIQAGKDIVDKDSTIITFTFKALKQTTTSISLSNLKASKEGTNVNINVSNSIDIKINRALSDNNDIVDLKPSVGKLDKEFNKDIYEYNLYVDYRVDSITLEGLLGDKYATTMGFREYKLTSDTTVILLEVVSESGEVKTYKINVIKEYPKATTQIMSLSSNNYLSSLIIDGYDIKFDKNTLEYEITVGSDVTSLDISATSEVDSASVRIYGNDDFSEGENIVTIVVTAEDGSQKTYTIKVNKEKEQASVADDTSVDDNNNNVEKTIIIILIILVVIGLLYLIFKKDKEENPANKK